jgi:RNA polymerase sigma-70 factor (family 1)
MFFKALKILDDKDEAKDAVQIVFVDLWNRRKENVILNLKPYLLNAVKYQVFNRLRDNKLTQKHIDRFDDILFYTHIDEEIDSSEISGRLSQAIEELPNKCRAVFKLSRVDNLSNREIAEKMGISIKTVENHITKAQQNLRSSLKNINN